MRGPFLILCAAAPLLIGAAEPVRLQPTTRWVVDYADNSCRLSRTFGAGKSETILLFESYSPDANEMIVVGKPLESSAEQVPARFLPIQERTAKELLNKGYIVRSADKDQPAIIYPHVEMLPDAEAAKVEAEQKQRRSKPRARPAALDVAQEKARRAMRLQFADATTSLEIRTRSNRPVILETGPLGKAIKALDDCARNSLRDWGVDPDLEDRIARPVWAENIHDLIRGEDYPSRMLDDGHQSDVRARVLVDATGRVTKCTSLSHFKLAEFTQLACDRITKSGKFLPAELADGTKVPSYYSVRINFRIAG